jgi:protein TonB
MSGGTWQRHLLAAMVMPAGAAAVLGTVVIMNEYSEPPEKKKVTTGSVVEVKKAPPPKPKQKVNKPRPRPRRAPSSPPPPSLAALSSGLSGIAVDIPLLGMEDVAGGAGELLGGQEDLVHTSDSVDQQPQPASRVAPEYPARLKKKGVEGFVLVSILVNKQGQVERAKILESKPPGEFDDVALEAARGWTFTPAQYKGEPVRQWAQLPFEFRLGS